MAQDASIFEAAINELSVSPENCSKKRGRLIDDEVSFDSVGNDVVGLGKSTDDGGMCKF